MNRLVQFLGALAVALTGLAIEAADRRAPATVFVLDASQSMGKPMPLFATVAVASDAEPQTRWDAISVATLETLDQLSVENVGSNAGVWLFGHRLAWEKDQANPGLIEQTEYLAHTMGFQVLKTLLPGDDVELARPVSPLEPRHMPALRARLEAVRPWGEQPLYLALVRAIDNLSRPAEQGRHRIIVLTDGDNQQRYCKFPASREQVIEAIDRVAGVEIHVIQVGNEPLSKQSKAELQHIVRHGQGTLQHATTLVELQACIERIVIGTPQAHESGSVTKGNSPVDREQLKLALTLLNGNAKAGDYSIEGKVTYYNISVPQASIKVEGNSVTRQVLTDNTGTYKITKLPPGTYKVRVECVFKNRIHEKDLSINVEESKEGVFRKDIALE